MVFTFKTFIILNLEQYMFMTHKPSQIYVITCI
jgi:hypothetical protein